MSFSGGQHQESEGQLRLGEVNTEDNYISGTRKGRTSFETRLLPPQLTGKNLDSAKSVAATSTQCSFSLSAN